MSELYVVSIDAVDGCTLRGRVHLVHPDVPDVRADRVFAAALLVDAWRCLVDGHALTVDDTDDGRRDRWPLGVEEGRRIATSMRRAAEYAELRDLHHGRRIDATADGFLFGGLGGRPRFAADAFRLGDRRDASLMSDKDKFAERAERVVETFTVSALHGIPTRGEVAAAYGVTVTDPDTSADLTDDTTWTVFDDVPFPRHPFAEVTITAAHESYLDHLVPGTRWGTAES